MQSITAYNIRSSAVDVQGLGQINAGSSKVGLVPDVLFDIDARAYRDRATKVGVVILDSAGIIVPTGYVAVTTTASLATTVRAVVASAAADYALTLMAASAVPSGEIVYFYFTTGIEQCTITRAGSDTIDGGTTVVLDAGSPIRRLRSNGVNAWTSV